jgi:redox-sensitive bicupin YhaK (pirin superfamily)
MSIEQIILGRERDLGGSSVRRILPAVRRPMVGPFVFFDHLGPAQFAPGNGVNVRAHPHIALATVTYLFSGALLHRDSLGFVQEIRPGDVNWMTAGRGIVHSERTPAPELARGMRIHGIQSWVALPDGHEDDAPAFVHHPASTLPQLNVDGAQLTVIAGEAFGHRSPVVTVWPTLYVDAVMPAGSAIEISSDHQDRAVYVAEGAVTLDAQPLEATQLATLLPGTNPSMRATSNARVMLLGGAKFPTPRHLWWNFVASSTERIERAKADWAAQRFAPVPGETEFIPLPER